MRVVSSFDSSAGAKLPAPDVSTGASVAHGGGTLGSVTVRVSCAYPAHAVKTSPISPINRIARSIVCVPLVYKFAVERLA
jgi:hypothetical protein